MLPPLGLYLLTHSLFRLSLTCSLERNPPLVAPLVDLIISLDIRALVVSMQTVGRQTLSTEAAAKV